MHVCINLCARASAFVQVRACALERDCVQSAHVMRVRGSMRAWPWQSRPPSGSTCNAARGFLLPRGRASTL
eukprot:15471655-Alexandrium_andersonii.AAC.1